MKKRFESLFQKVSAKELQQNVYLRRMQSEILKTISEGITTTPKPAKIPQDVGPSPREVGHGR